MLLFKILLLINLGLLVTTTKQNHSISKRSLLFPRATVLQLTFGVSAPLILPKRSINFSVALQANYDLPSNISQLQTKVISAKSTSEKFDLSRHKFYEYLTTFIDSLGLDGGHCLSRTICELAQHPMHLGQREGLLEEIVHFIFTPSLDLTSLDFYGKAEDDGKTTGNCHNYSSLCPISIVELFTGKFLINN